MTLGRSTSTNSIPRVKDNIEKRTLGVRLSPGGSFEGKFTHCQQQALKWIRTISIVPLSWEGTYAAYCTMWCPSVKFLLPVTFFTKKQCKTLQWPFTSPFLAKMRTSTATYWALAFAPYQYSGYSIADTWVQQGPQHLHFLLDHSFYQDKVGHLLKIIINTL